MRVVFKVSILAKLLNTLSEQHLSGVEDAEQLVEIRLLRKRLASLSANTKPSSFVRWELKRPGKLKSSHGIDRHVPKAGKTKNRLVRRLINMPSPERDLPPFLLGSGADCSPLNTTHNNTSGNSPSQRVDTSIPRAPTHAKPNTLKVGGGCQVGK